MQNFKNAIGRRLVGFSLFLMGVFACCIAGMGHTIEDRDATGSIIPLVAGAYMVAKREPKDDDGFYKAG